MKGWPSLVTSDGVNVALGRFPGARALDRHRPPGPLDEEDQRGTLVKTEDHFSTS